VEFIFRGVGGDTLEAKLRTIIESEPGITRRELCRKFPRSEKPEAIVAALGKLAGDGSAHFIKVGKSEQWYPGRQSETPESAANAANSLAVYAAAKCTWSGGASRAIPPAAP
jgi:hypothetical protein